MVRKRGKDRKETITERKIVEKRGEKMVKIGKQ
jgi:hypothetical protein